MTPDIERFLHLATRSLEASPGEREEAKGELMSRIAHGGVPYELLDLSEPVGKLEGAAPPKPGLRRSLLVSGSLLLTAAAVVAMAFLVWEIVLMGQASFMSVRARYGSSFGSDADFMPVLKHVRTIAPDLPLGLHPETGGPGETSAALAEHPDDLAMLQEHIVRQLRHGSPWSGYTEEEQETIARLDADNALWSLLEIAPAMAKATGRTTASWHYGTATITSEPDFEEALRIFSEAAAKPAYFDRSDSLKRRLLDAFPPARSLSESMVATGFAELASPPFDHTGSLGSFAQLHADRLAAAGDKEGLVKFFQEWKQLNKSVIGSPESGRNDNGSIFLQLAAMGRPLVEAFDTLGMAAEKAEAEAQMNALYSLTMTTSHSLPEEVTEAKGLRLASAGRLPSDLTVEEVIPSRRAELSFFDRVIASAFSCFALVFAGLVAFETCRRSRIVKGMARGLMPLFRREDQAWIAGLGLALPWLWWWALARMSPLGWRDSDLDEGWPAAVWAIQFSAALIFAAVMLLQTARWRWSVRGGFLGLGVSMPWIGWGVAVLTGLAIPVAGSLRYFSDSLSDDENGFFLLGVAGMVACGILWLLWQGVMTLFTPRSGALRPNLNMRAILPWAMAGVATLLASVVISAVMERHWFARDPLLPASTSKTHINALEERVARETREAVRDL